MTFRFGKYRGQPLAEIPREYLLWAVKIAREPLRRAIHEELMRRDDERVHDHYHGREEASRPDRSAALRIVKAGFRAVVMKVHPDTGGDHTQMVALNRAHDWLVSQIEVLA